MIIISGQGKLGDAIQALRLGGWDYITKPIEDVSFQRLAIERVLEKVQLIKKNRDYREHLEELVALKSADLLYQQQVLIEKPTILRKPTKRSRHSWISGVLKSSSSSRRWSTI